MKEPEDEVQVYEKKKERKKSCNNSAISKHYSSPGGSTQGVLGTMKRREVMGGFVWKGGEVFK